MALAGIDLTIVVIYAIALFAIAQWVSREQTGHQKDAADYFLAGRGLPWWAIGTSLIAANISAEQIIGMCRNLDEMEDLTPLFNTLTRN